MDEINFILTLILFPLFDSSSSNLHSIPLCDETIVSQINDTFQSSSSLRIPFGQSYLSYEYNIAYTFKQTNSRPKLIHNNKGYFSGKIVPCKVLNDNIKIPRKSLNIEFLCNLTFYGRLIGKEIILPSISPIIYKHHQTCHWSVSFPYTAGTPIGTYKLEIFSSSINGLQDPTQSEFDLIPSDRCNRGNIINLSGIGHHPSFLLNPTWESLNLNCSVFIPVNVNGKPINNADIYFLYNHTKILASYSTILSLGYVIRKNVFKAISAFLNLFPINSNISTDEQFLQWYNQTTCATNNHILNNITSEEVAILTELSGIINLQYGNPAWNYSQVFNVPEVINITAIDLLPPPYPNNTESTTSMALPYCNADRISHHFNYYNYTTTMQRIGKWKYFPECASYDSNWRMKPLINSAPFGSSCLHTMNSIDGDSLLNIRASAMVWVPEYCKLRHHYICPINDILCLKSYNTSGLSNYMKLINENIPIIQQRSNTNVSNDEFSYSSFVDCLERSNISLIIGYGDSIFDEINSNIMELLTIRQASQPASSSFEWLPGKVLHFPPFAYSTRLSKMLDGRNINELVVRNNISHTFIKNFNFLSNHILQIVKNHFYGSKNNRQHGSSIAISHHDENKLGVVPPSNSTVVFYTNFMALHLLEKIPVYAITNLYQLQVKAIATLSEILQSKYNVNLRKIFVTGTAVHGFRAVGITNEKMKLLNSEATQIFYHSGWEVMDAYDITIGRPDGTYDGIHYKGGVSYAISDSLTTLMC